MELVELVYFIKFMMYFGDVIDFLDILGIKVDKYLIGGVGDKIILVVVFICAVLGVLVVKMLGRGLGYIGGIIDKLELILGFIVEFIEV